MRKAILTNRATGQQIHVYATTDNPASSYGHAVWADSEGNAYCEVDGITDNPLFSIHEAGGAPIGAQIRRLRVRQGVSAAELAKRCGMARPNISKIEAGNYNPSARVLQKIAAALGGELKIEIPKNE